MCPDSPRNLGVGRGEFHREHLRGGRGARNPQRAVSAVGAEFEHHAGIGPPDRGIEQRTLLVTDVDQNRLLVGELVDRGEHVVDVAASGVAYHVIRGRSLPAVADLAGGGDVASAERKPPHRPAQERNFCVKFTV